MNTTETNAGPAERRPSRADGWDGFRSSAFAARSRPSWGAIWAGFFAILGIEVVVTMLMVGVFANIIQLNPAALASSSLTIGIALWLFLQTIGAFYVGGRITGILSRPLDASAATGHALAVWGLTTVVLAYGIASIGGPAVGANLAFAGHGLGIVESAVARAGALPGIAGAANGPIAAAAALATWLPIYLFLVLGVSYLTMHLGTMSGARQEGLLTRR